MIDALITTKELRFLDLIEYPDIGIAAGQATFISGESGCGKSTLLKLFNGVLSPTGGRILYNGRAIVEYDPIPLRKELLLCAQSVFLFNDTIAGNFRQFYDYRGQPLPGGDTLRSYLNLCNLNVDLDADCETMSGGERHRVFLAVCLSFMPKVLMLDEPTAALDSQNADSLIRNIILFCKETGITPIIVCHNDMLVKKYADKIIKLEGKR